MSWFQSLFKTKERPKRDASSILPVLRTTVPGAGSPVQIPLEGQPIVEPLIGDLLVCYAFDIPHLWQFVSRADCDRLDIQPASLRGIALENLRARVPHLTLKPIPPVSPPVYMVAGGQGHEAAFLLVSFFWDSNRTWVSGDVVVAAPARDVVFLTGSQSPEGLSGLRDIIERTHSERQQLLTRSLLVWREGEWRVYDHAA